MRLSPELRRFTDVYRRTLYPSSALASAALLFVAALAAVHAARTGTEHSRILALALLFGGLVVLAGRFWFGRVALSTPARAIRVALISNQPKVGKRVLRAYRLKHDSSKELGSPQLRALHYERALALVNLDVIRQASAYSGGLFRRFAWVALCGVLLVIAFSPRHPLEGANILFAQNGAAPVPMMWLDYTQVTALPPSYLGQPKSFLMMQSASALPEGTQLTFRGRPLHSGRSLVLTDGETEVAFSDDGSGNFVARWELVAPRVLRVAARFGEVLIYEPGLIELHSQLDRSPVVKLEHAPATYELEKLQRLELNWSARDDYSLVQVELVLRSAGREERRPLERYPGDKKVGSGGHVLFAEDPFFKRLFLPATIVIEARDNDPRHGNKWGKSEAVTIRPPSVGAPLVRRYEALKSMRNKWVEFLAERLLVAAPKLSPLGLSPSATERQALLVSLSKVQSITRDALAQSYEGAPVPKGWVAFTRAQTQLVDKAYRARKGELEVTEGVVLALDRALSRLAESDARKVSKQLGDVAEEAAFAARLAQSAENRNLGVQRLDIAIEVLAQGAVELSRLGMLGADLGSVATGDLGRVRSSRGRLDLLHAELAALHMAARLHRPNPSFGSKGGGGGGGVESGPGMGGGGGGDASGEASDADSQFDKLAQDLEQLAQEHSDSIARTSSALARAEADIVQEGVQEEALRRAKLLRLSVLRLPQPGAAPGSSRASAALTREHTGAMAHELGRLHFAEALESGRRAKAAAEEALRVGQMPMQMSETLRKASEVLDEQLRWVSEQAERRGRLTHDAAKQQLLEVASWENELAERARRMAAETDDSVALPEEVKERLREAQGLMSDAARRLASGEGTAGLNLQRQAQRLLEESETGKTSDGADEGTEGKKSSAPGEHGRASSEGGTVPDANEKSGAEDFRKRVLDGLAKSQAGRLSPAVQRYAEGLLR